MKTWIGVFCIFWASANSASAAIVMVDINLNFKEQETVQKAAQAIGEKVYFIPQISLEKRPKINALKIEFEKKQDHMLELSLRIQELSRQGKSNTPAFLELYEQLKLENEGYQILSDSFDSMLKEIPYTPPLSKDQSLIPHLKATFDTIRENKETVTQLVISGHSGTGHFMGFVGRISRSEILQLLLLPEYEDLTESIQSLLLWGCYSMNPGESLEWARALPNLDLAAGFYEKAPREDKLVDHTYLQALIQHREKFVQFSETQTAAQIVELKNKLATIVGLKESSYALLINNTFYASQGRIQLTSELHHGCFEADMKTDSIAVQEIHNLYIDVISKYLHPKSENPPEFEDPPANTGSENPIRQFYNKLQALKHCVNIRISTGGASSIDDSLKVIQRLLFFRNVYRNWLNSSYTQGYIQNYNKTVLQPGEPPIEFHPGMSRAQVLNQLKTMSEKPSTAQGALTIYYSIYALSPSEIPDSWIE